MNAAWKTAEFWTALVTNIVGVVVLFGGVTGDQASDLTTASTQIVGALLMIATSFGFIKARVALRSSIATAAIYSASNQVTRSVPESDGGPVVTTSSSSVDVKKVLRDAGV